MKKFLRRTLIILIIVYVAICGLLFLFQEKMIFFPQKLEQAYQFNYPGNFEEKNIRLADGTLLHGLLFKAAHSKGLIFYLHGNAGSLASWGSVADTYTNLDYDVYIIDYRGFGKSGGSIGGQQQLYDDIQTAYDEMKKSYPENQIVVLGYSIGTGPAAKLVSNNNPKMLILQAPYYNLQNLMRRRYPIIPTFILKYRFDTNNYLADCKCPVVIFHGDEDEVIPHQSSIKLSEEHNKVELITLNGQGHNGITENPDYKAKIKEVLN